MPCRAGIDFWNLLARRCCCFGCKWPEPIAPVFFFPPEVFSHFPYAPTLEGKYIIKNLVLASAGIVVGVTVRGGRLRS